jgi:hypothetical protein
MRKPPPGKTGPASSPLRERYFKQKDVVENHLTAQVRSENMDLAEAQKQIGRDWTQVLDTRQRLVRHAQVSG